MTIFDICDILNRKIKLEVVMYGVGIKLPCIFRQVREKYSFIHNVLALKIDQQKPNVENK